MRLLLLRVLHFISIFTDAIKLEVIDFDISKWHCEALSSYQFITVLLQGERLNQPGLTKCSNTLKQFVSNTTVNLSHLHNPAHSHHLSCIRLPKCIRNEGCFIFFTRHWVKNRKNHFHSVEIGMIFLFVSI